MKSGNSNHGASDLPLGEPQLAWSLNRDNKADPELLKRRQKALEMELSAIREQRADRKLR